MYIHELDEHHTATARRFPCVLNQSLWNKPIDENVEMGITVLLELKNTDVNDQGPELSL